MEKLEGVCPRVSYDCLVVSPKFFSEDLLKRNLLDFSDSEIMNIKSYTSDFEKMEVGKDKLIKKVLNLVTYFFDKIL